jgi:hypothetical protein
MADSLSAKTHRKLLFAVIFANGPLVIPHFDPYNLATGPNEFLVLCRTARAPFAAVRPFNVNGTSFNDGSGSIAS